MITEFPERPALAALTFAVHDSPLQIETALAERRVDWPGGGFSVRLTEAGHTLEWRNGGITIMEILSTLHAVTPRLTLPVTAERRGKLRIDSVKYEVGLQVEVLTLEVFVHVHDEIVADGTRRGLFHRFAPYDRVQLTPLSLVAVEQVPGGLAIATFHTFPAELAIVKTQSLIEPGVAKNPNSH